MRPEVLPDLLERHVGLGVASRRELLGEGGSEGLDPKLERSEIVRLVEALHLLRHKRLVYRLALGVGGVDFQIIYVSESTLLQCPGKGGGDPRFEQSSARNSMKIGSMAARRDGSTPAEAAPI